MAAKTESPSIAKPSPSERLARKRAAARLRQQRCRARKRQAMLETRRQGDGTRQGFSVSQDSGAELSKHRTPSHNSSFAVVQSKRFLPSSPPREPIYNCVSFDSQRSFEEAQRALTTPMVSRSSSEESITATQSSSSSAKKPVEAVTVSQSNSEEPLVAEEEAAIAAMLSLKSGGSSASSSPSSSPSSPEGPHPIVAQPSAKLARYHYYRDWEPRVYESYGYGRHGRSPPYYGMVMHHRATAPRDGYYGAYNKGYSRYDYE